MLLFRENRIQTIYFLLVKISYLQRKIPISVAHGSYLLYN